MDAYKKPRVIDEVGLPAGLFPGTSKMTFDVLHHAETEAAGEGRPLQLTRRQLLSLTNIRSLKTLSAHVRHFRELGLVSVEARSPGDHGGNLYKVHADRIPEVVARLDGRRPKLGRPATRVAP